MKTAKLLSSLPDTQLLKWLDHVRAKKRTIESLLYSPQISNRVVSNKREEYNTLSETILCLKTEVKRRGLRYWQENESIHEFAAEDGISTVHS